VWIPVSSVTKAVWGLARAAHGIPVGPDAGDEGVVDLVLARPFSTKADSRLVGMAVPPSARLARPLAVGLFVGVVR